MDTKLFIMLNWIILFFTSSLGVPAYGAATDTYPNNIGGYFIILQAIAIFAEYNSYLLLKLLPYVMEVNEPNFFVIIMFGEIPTLLAVISTLISAISLGVGFYIELKIVQTHYDYKG